MNQSKKASSMSSSSTNDETSTKKSDEEKRKCLKPNPSDDQIVKAISETYKSTNVSILKELESYDDRNYLVTVDGQKFLAKVYNGVESSNYIRATASINTSTSTSTSITTNGDDHPHHLSSIHLYSFIFQHLKQSKFKINTSSPHPIPGKTAPPHVSIHEFPVTSQQDSPQKLALSLLTWVEGTTMSSSPMLPIETLADAGRYLGNVCVALDELSSTNDDARRAADRYHAWDGKNVLDIEMFLPCIQNQERRDLVKSVLSSFRTDLMESGDVPKLRVSILQGDFNDGNILLDEEKNVTGVIDFGDTTLSWRVLDISVAMAYAMISSYGKINRSISAGAAILRGFHSVYPLTKVERKHLRLLVAARLSCSATLGAYSYQQNPENKYLLLHAEPAWKTLELIWGNGGGGGGHDFAAMMDTIFDQACDNCTVCEKNGFIHCTDIGFPDPSIVDHLSTLRSTQKRSRTTDVNTEEATTKKLKTNDDDTKDVITFVTGNKKKLEEVKRILSTSNDSNSLPFTISNQKIDLPELQGDPLEIAEEKCALAAKEVGGAVITEDTSLCFNALNDMPGPYIKWFLDKCGHDGLNKMIDFSDDKSGYAQTVVGFCAGPGKKVIVFDGRTQGRIVPPRGPLDFGWDPIFQPDEGKGKTYAEMKKEEKDAISHRSRAFGKLRLYLQKEAVVIKSEISPKI